MTSSIITLKRDVFISYQWDIKDKVAKLDDFLQSKSYTVYRDEHTFNANSFLGSQISQAIKNSEVFICCITEAYNDSKSCLNEISLATEIYKKPLIALMFENCDLAALENVNFYIARYLRINLFEDPNVMNTWSGPKCDAMIRALNQALNIESQEKYQQQESVEFTKIQSDSNVENNEFNIEPIEKDEQIEPECEENNLLGVVCSSMQVRVMDIDKQQCVGALESKRAITKVRCLSKKWFVTICDDVLVKLWDLTSGDCVLSVQAHDMSVTDVTLIRENTLVTCGCDNKIKFWSLRQKKLKMSLDNSNSIIGSFLGVHCLQVIDENTLASGGCRGRLKIWNVNTFTCSYKLDGHEKSVKQLALMDTHLLASSGEDKIFRLWCLKTQMCIRFWDLNESVVAKMVALNPDTIAFARRDGKIAIYNVYKGEIVRLLEDDETPVSYLRLIESNKLACVKHMNCSIWDLERNKKCKIF